MIFTHPPDLPWLPMEFWCDRCTGGFLIEMSDLGGRVRTLPKWIDGEWTVQMSCPYCRQAGHPHTRKEG